MNKLKCVIFDLDGLLVDSESFRYKVWTNVFSDFNISFNKFDYINHWVSKGSGLDGFLYEKNLANLKNNIIKNHRKYFNENIDKISLNIYEGVTDLINDLILNNIQIAIATSSEYDEAIKILKNVKLLEYFSVIVTANDVEKIKPFPDMYLYLLKKLSLNPQNCIALDDAQKGIEAAYKAKIFTVAVPNKYTKNNNFKNASYIINSLKFLYTKKLQKILEGS